MTNLSQVCSADDLYNYLYDIGWVEDGFNSNIDKLYDEIDKIRVENAQLRTLLGAFADVAPDNEYYRLSNGMTAGQLRSILERQ